MLVRIIVTIIGISSVPLCVAEAPITPCRNSGMNRIVPNMPMDMIAHRRDRHAHHAVLEQVQWDDRFDRTRLDQPEIHEHDRGQREQADDDGEPQAYALPPHDRASSNGTTPITRSAAPR